LKQLPVLRGQTLMMGQEFSIEIPDKEADAIHSGKWRSTQCDI